MNDHRMIIYENKTKFYENNTNRFHGSDDYKENKKYNRSRTQINVNKALGMTTAGMMDIERSILLEIIRQCIDVRIRYLKTVAEQSIPFKVIFPDKPKWWNQRLDTLKRELYHKRRMFRSERDPEERDILKQEYSRAARNTLNATMRKRC